MNIPTFRPVLTALTAILLLGGCSTAKHQAVPVLLSPEGKVRVEFLLTGDNKPAYTAGFHDLPVIDTSTLGFDLKDAPPLSGQFRVTGFSTDTVSESYDLPWGEVREVENRYNSLLVELRENRAPYRRLNIEFRAYDDGMAFRYIFPEQKGFTEAVILEENSMFRLTADHECWWIPGDWDSYEHLYNQSLISEIDAPSKFDPGLNFCCIRENAVQTPLTMKTSDGIYLSIHEADLTDYAGITLLADTMSHSFISALVDSDREEAAVKRSLPFRTPWRMIQMADRAGDLIESHLLLNLNEPNKLGDVSWIKPAKYNGIWWEMHLGVSSWDMESGHHGATTANAKRYIDFASDNGLGAVLIEGWNTGWNRWTGIPDREGVFDFVTPYPDYKLEEVVKYAHEKGIELIMHHETSSAPRTYEQQLDTAYRLMQHLGIHYAKLGYVGQIIPEGEHHHGQWMVNHYRKVLETAASYRIAINIHEPIAPTGLRRTYPNLISAEGLRGQEFNAWAADGGNPPDHLTIVPFTRMLAGPIDYTPGIFDIMLKPYRPDNRVNTTLAQQLALYVVIYSPVQMAADLPESYKGKPGLAFIRDVAVDWEKTVVPEGEPGEYIVVARKERNGERWFIGAVNGLEPKILDLDLDFLDREGKYRAVIYRDGPGADWDKNPLSMVIDEKIVNSKSKLYLTLAAGGGTAIELLPVKDRTD